MGNEGNEMEMETVRVWIKKLSSFDHRRAQRLESPLLVAYYWDGSVPVGHEIRDISSSGFYLVTTERWHSGTVVTMTLQRSDIVHRDVNGDNYISVLSRVVRSGEDGVGFAFVPLETKGSRKKDVSPRSRPVGRKALYRFLEQLNLDQGHATIESNLGNGKEVLLGQDASSAVPGATVMRRLKDESGQSLVIAAFCMTCLMGCVALAADVGLMLRAKRLLQTAADSAAIAGALEINFAAMDGNTVTNAANLAAQKNGFTNGSNGVTITVNPTPTSGPHAGLPGYVEVIAAQSQPTFFMQVFGRSSMTVSARAVATNLSTTSGCVYTLGTTGTDLSMTGNANIQITTCGIIDDSSSRNALSANGNVTLDAQSIGVVGGVRKTGNVSISPTPVTGIVSTSDPLAFLPAPTVPKTCSADPGYSGTVTKTLTPGCYNGLSASGNVNLTLTSGLYIINGALNLGGNTTLTGANVTLDLLGSSSFPGNTALNLTAPTSGTYDGVVIYQPLSNPNPISLNGNSGSTFQGIIYAPGSAVSLTGNSGSSIYADFVAKSLSLVGNASFNDYSAINSSSVLTAVKLVE
jgi:hypothetical protein